MRTITARYSSRKALCEFITQHHIVDSPSLLIQVFTSECDLQFISQLADFFRTQFPLASLIGATTDGEICNGEVLTDSTVISFSIFEITTLHTFISNECRDFFQAGAQLAKSIVGKDTKVILSFIDGLSGNGEEFLKGISSIEKKVIVAGGLAGDNAMFTKTYVFTKEQIVSCGVVGVSLSSQFLRVFTDYSFDWQIVGKVLTITKAEKNRVFTIDDRTAVEAYSYYLGEGLSEQLPKVGIEFPLIIQKKGLTVARAPIAKEDDGSLIFAGNVNTGDKVQFGCGDFDSILNETQSHIDKLFTIPVETLFIYSCMARRRFIPNEIHHETMVYNEIAPTSGFYTYGEFFSYRTQKELLNQSMTVLALSESERLSKKRVKVNVIKHQNTTLQALTRLINVSTREHSITQKKLELMSITDPLTKLYNRRYFAEVSENIYEISHRESCSLSIIMLDIDKFKQINDTYGHKVGDQVLIQFAAILQKTQRKSDIACRYGGEEFVLLLLQTTIEGASVVAENIRYKTESSGIQLENKKKVNFTVSAGVSEVHFAKGDTIEQVLNRADGALYTAKNNGRNQIVCL